MPQCIAIRPRTECACEQCPLDAQTIAQADACSGKATTSSKASQQPRSCTQKRKQIRTPLAYQDPAREQ